MRYLLISGILFVLSIVAFFIRNGMARLTFREIIGRGSYPGTRPWSLTNYPGIILMFGAVFFILWSPLHPVVTICIGILFIFSQRLIIWMTLSVIARLRK